MSDAWEAIRDLDDRENWIERTAVLSKDDHTHLMECAKDILLEVVDSLPVDRKEGNDSDCKERNDDPVEEFTDEDFQYSAAQFDMDYLESISTEKSSPSELTRQSLYVKFDPLVGKDSPKAVRIAPSTSGDLLMLNTPPAPGIKSCLSNKSTSSDQKKHVHIGMTETLPESPLVSLNTPQSRGGSTGRTVSLIDSSPTTQTQTDTQQEETDYPDPPPSIQDTVTPPTDTLIKVLKYSEEDLIRMRQDTIAEAREKIRKEKEEEMDAVRREIAAVKREAKKLQAKDNSLKTAVSSHQTVVAKLEAEIEQFRERIAAQVERENDVLEHHDSCLKDLNAIKERGSIIRDDVNHLENIFEDTHKSYIALKNTHKNLSAQTESLERRKTQLQQWNEESAALVLRVQEEHKQQAEEIETTLEQIRKELIAKKSLEKAKQDQLQMQLEGLEKSIEHLEQEKTQLSAMCEELMKAM